MRAFLAIDLPEAAEAAVAPLQEALGAGRAVPAENLHLTLAFLGEQPEPALGALDDVLERLRAPDFELEPAGLEIFGAKAAEAVALGIRPSPALDHLHGKLRAAIHAAGLDLPRARFRPHVTIARFGRRPEGRDRARLAAFLAAHGDVRLPPFPAGGVTLFRSTLTRDGAIHEALRVYPLG